MPDASNSGPDRLLSTCLVLGLLAMTACSSRMDTVAPPPHAAPPSAPVAPVAVDPPAGPATTLVPAPASLPVPAAPSPAAAPDPSPTAGQLQSIILADGRRFIGTYDAKNGTIMVTASVRGGTVTRMQAITVRAEAAAVASVAAYDGSLGDLGVPYVAVPVDPVRAIEVAEAREAAAARAEQRRKEAAEQERVRQLAARRAAAVQRLAAAKADLLDATQREERLAGLFKKLAEDRLLKLELINGLQLQFNRAEDRWNREVQELGPRVTKPDGTMTGGPTPATEVLVNNLRNQIQQAQRAVAAAEQAQRNETAARQALTAEIARLNAEIASASAALLALDP